MFPDFKLYCKANAIKTVWYGQKQTHRSMEQNKDHRNKPTFTWSIKYDDRSKNIQ